MKQPFLMKTIPLGDVLAKERWGWRINMSTKINIFFIGSDCTFQNLSGQDSRK